MVERWCAERRREALMVLLRDTNVDMVAGAEVAPKAENAEKTEIIPAIFAPRHEESFDRQIEQEPQSSHNNKQKSESSEPWGERSWRKEKETEDEHTWLAEMQRRLRHRTERSWLEEGSSLSTSRGTTGGGGNTAGGFSGIPSGSSGTGSSGGGGVAGPTQGGASSSKQGSSGSQDSQQTDVDLDEFGYPDSPTQSWLAENSDLSPLQILDNINLKSEFPYSSVQVETDKPPDISNIGMDSTTANLLQFAASVPVPDHSTTFLDIGLDTFQSLYEDHLISDLIPTNNNFNTFEPNFNVLKSGFIAYKTESQTVDLKSLGIQLPLHGVSTGETTISCLQPPLGLKSLIEPLPASALQGLIKVEPSTSSSPGAIKEEEDGDGYHTELHPCSPGSPCGGKMKSSRKKSTASTDEEDDISNIPSLQMRIQIIQQRVSNCWVVGEMSPHR